MKLSFVPGSDLRLSPGFGAPATNSSPSVHNDARPAKMAEIGAGLQRMHNSIRRFVHKILWIHLLLLALLLAVVTSAARHVYETARVQALRQAQVRQNLLVSQTAHGVDGFFSPILSDL